MPKIFVLRHQLAEQQAKLKLQAKGSDPSGSASPNSDEEKFDPQPPGQVIVNPASPPQTVSAVEQPLELISRQQKITGRHRKYKFLIFDITRFQMKAIIPFSLFIPLTLSLLYKLTFNRSIAFNTSFKEENVDVPLKYYFFKL